MRGRIRRSVKLARRVLRDRGGPIASPQRILYERGILSTDRFRLPDFLGIGGIKAATTWLYENLACHPDLFLPPHKEVHYFDINRDQRLSWYSSQFEGAGDALAGDITPSYGLLPVNRIHSVRRLIPDARLLLIMRNPVDRAWSHAVMKLARERDRPVEQVSDTEFRAFFTGERCKAAGDYEAMIARWTSVYPKEQLLTIWFDDVEARPSDVLTRVFAHLGVSTDVDLSGFPVSTVIDRGVRGALSVEKQSRTQIPDHFRDDLIEMYREPIDRLSQRLGDVPGGWISPRLSC